MNKLHHQRGITVILFAVILTVLIGFTGLALDGGYLYLQRTRLQSAADAYALACVINPNACQRGSNAFVNDLGNPYNFTITLTQNAPCPKSSQQGCAKAVASTSWTPFFLGILQVGQLSPTATAIAGRNTGGPSCVIDVNNFSPNGTNNVNLKSCSAAIGGALKATNNSGIVISPNTNQSTITVYNGKYTACNSCSPAPIGSSGSLPQLPTYTAPTVAAAAAPTYNSGTYTYYPGTYASKVTFDKKYSYVLSNGSYGGVYVFNGGLDTGSATVTNSPGGVSLYIPGSQSLALNGSVTLSAPTPANCTAGSAVVINHPYTTKYYTLDLKGAGDQVSLTGVANLGADNLTVSGTSSSISITGSLVTNSVVLHGNMNPQLSQNPCNNINLAGPVALVF